jgi:diphosphomevalonate decarboxylase
MHWTGSAPSNIALIKYMGKEGSNLAVNPSLSMSLAEFRTTVEIEEIAGNEDCWRPLPGSAPLRAESTARFVHFFQKLKTQAEIQGAFEIRSGNNFPSDAGLASSASSFAALTLTAHTAFAALKGRPLPSAAELARISRSGSGSSCRSFFAPWCAWEGDAIGELEAKLPPLVDLVAVMDGGFKKVSSSAAHQRVRTSPLFTGRVERAQSRMQKAKAALAAGEFQALAEISWAEMWDMHSLFHTSEPPFFYFCPATLAVLRWAEDRWEQKGRGPITTIDAGPNVHLLVPKEEVEIYRRELASIPGIRLLESGA